MDKKSGLIIFVFCILAFSVFVIAQSGDTGSGAAGAEDMDKLTKPIADLIGSENKTQFLMTEWSKLLNKTWIGPVFERTSNFFTFLNPFLNIVLGANFSFSWHFFLTLLIWLLILAFSFNFLHIIEVYMSSLKNAKLARLGAFLAIFILVSSIRIPRFVSLAIISSISAAKYWALQLTLIIVVFIAIIFLFLYSGIMKRHFKKLRTLKDIKINREEIEEEKKEIREMRRANVGGRGKKEEEDSEEAKSEIEGMSDEV